MFAAGVIGSFVLYLVIGAVVGRKVKTRSDYYVAGRNAPTLLVAGTLVASFLSTVSFMGELGFSNDGFPVVMLILSREWGPLTVSAILTVGPIVALIVVAGRHFVSGMTNGSLKG